MADLQICGGKSSFHETAFLNEFMCFLSSTSHFSAAYDEGKIPELVIKPPINR